ncbi:hypothetical protein HN51_038318 [Arachis hypogaea]|uniref:Uncharacterized protein n=1 Tax=Arachis hypogaea TaxID=3818 RepID=A0A444ZSS2_ARAHY|nr:uncharacterized protein LOC112792505 isoform X1 [Arachis hypogaea]QHO04018.1 uncharacterized protein DS421_13g437040 [Arachis hypogaea]RYR17142.1 hypothetical protein Ahy_B03g061927 [Arachis hypogaea]
MQLSFDAPPESPDVAANPNNEAEEENPELGALLSEQMRRHESFCEPNIKPDEINPITPEPLGENGDFAVHLHSPLTIEAKQLKLDSDSNGSPRTPKGSVFDPFAPGPEHLMRAPQGKKYLELNIGVSRRLDFPHSHSLDASYDEEESLSDQEIFDSLCKDLMKVIVSNQTEVAYCTTPPKLLPVFSASPGTCPPAPIKLRSGANPRNTNSEVGLCKKLEF